MIKREHIKQAIDAISSQNPEIGYSLDEMFGMGLIDVPSRTGDAASGEEPFFLFEGERVTVNKVLFFERGTAPIEQGLLIKYGELVKREELQERSETIRYQEAWQEIHTAGLKSAVNYEIDRAIAQLKRKLEAAASGGQQKEATFCSGLVYFLEALKEDPGPLEIKVEGKGSPVLYRGVVDENTQAYFMCFPMHMESLMQVADINVEFFSVRFILNCLMHGVERNLMACLVEQRIVGLLYLDLREKFLKKDLEIKFFATLRGKQGSAGMADLKPLKGVGTFLVAGAWMLWKSGLPHIKEVVLDSEVGARHFYESMGFESRGLSGYVLKRPKGPLLKSILIMTTFCGELQKEAIEALEELLRRQVKGLRKRAKSEKALSERALTVAVIRRCLDADVHPAFGKAAIETLVKYKKKIPESSELIEFAFAHAPDEVIQHATGIGR
jgi:hypothetical protein